MFYIFVVVSRDIVLTIRRRYDMRNGYPIKERMIEKDGFGSLRQHQARDGRASTVRRARSPQRINNPLI